VQTEQALNDFLLSLGKHLKLVGCMGMTPVYNVRNSLVVEELEKNGVKLWLVSDERREKNLTDFEAIDLYENYTDSFKVKGDTGKQIHDSIMFQLKVLND
jgi:hypothetical protein